MKKNRNRQKFNRTISVLRVILFAVLGASLVLGLVYAVSMFSEKDDSLSEELVNGAFYSVSSDSVKQIEPFSGGAVVLTDTAVKYLDYSCNETSSNEQTFSNPVLKTNGKNTLIYDLGGYSLRTEKNGSVFNKATFTSVITNAAIGAKGNYAYVLNSDSGFQSHLYIYSYKSEKLFEWGSASDYITGVTLSDNGKYACVSVLTVKNGVRSSRVILFSFSKAEPLFTLDFPGEIVYDTGFITNRKLFLYSDSGVYIADSDGDKAEVLTYSPGELNRSAASNADCAAVALKLYGNEKNSGITVMDRTYKNKYEYNIQDAVTGLCASGDIAAVVLTDKCRVYNTENSLVGVFGLQGNCISCCLSGNRFYALTNNGITVYSAKQNERNDTQQ